MHSKISKQTKGELLEALRERYLRVSKKEKARILDEFVAVAGCHRKHAIRLLTSCSPVVSNAPAVGQRIYDEAVREALIVLGICGSDLWQTPQGDPT